MNFKDYFSLEQFEELFHFTNTSDKDVDNAWRKKYQDLNDKNFNIPLMNFLTDYRDTQGLKKINFSEGHNSNFGYAWNNFVENKPVKDYLMNKIPHALNKVLHEGTYHYKEKPVTPEIIKEKYEKLADKVTNGNFERWDLSEDNCECHECGQRLRCVAKNWQIAFAVLDTRNDVFGLYKPESCIEKKVIELPITFKTGELLMADWFRIPEFTQAVQFNKDHTQSINNGAGRIASTKYHLEFGFISVVLGNCSPEIFQHENNLVFGHIDENVPKVRTKLKSKGSICTDLWAATIIEKEQLISIVQKQGSFTLEDATKKVNDYLKDIDFQTVHVTPGDYTLKFHANYYDFSKTVENEDLPSNMGAYFMITPALPTKTKKLKM